MVTHPAVHLNHNLRKMSKRTRNKQPDTNLCATKTSTN